MKSLVIAWILFISVIALVAADYIVLNNLIEDTKKELETIPGILTELEKSSKKEKSDIKKSLEKIENKWSDRETFLCLSLKHNVSREFMGYIVPAISYFKSKEYPEFLALIMSAKDTLDHISFDEGIKLGNLL